MTDIQKRAKLLILRDMMVDMKAQARGRMNGRTYDKYKALEWAIMELEHIGDAGKECDDRR